MRDGEKARGMQNERRGVIEIDGGDEMIESESEAERAYPPPHTHTHAPTVNYVWGVGRNMRGMAALGSTRPHNGS